MEIGISISSRTVRERLAPCLKYFSLLVLSTIECTRERGTHVFRPAVDRYQTRMLGISSYPPPPLAFAPCLDTSQMHPFGHADVQPCCVLVGWLDLPAAPSRKLIPRPPTQVCFADRMPLPAYVHFNSNRTVRLLESEPVRPGTSSSLTSLA